MHDWQVFRRREQHRKGFNLTRKEHGFNLTRKEHTKASVAGTLGV